MPDLAMLDYFYGDETEQFTFYRVFIYFTLDDALEYLCCGHIKAVSLFGELDKAGLIERRKQGRGKPTKIYVKNFVRNAEVKTFKKRSLIILN